MTAHQTAGETAAEIRLRSIAENPLAFDFVEPRQDAAAIDMGREALALLGEIHAWRDKSVPDDVADAIEERIAALLARARGDA